MDEVTRLAAALAAKDRLNEDEQGLYMALLPYLEAHYRLALLMLRKQAVQEGFTDEELRGTPSATS